MQDAPHVQLRKMVYIAGALADESRLRMLLALRAGEVCVCQLIELLDLAPSTVSQHLAVLRQAGLVDSRKEGRWVHYRLADPAAGGLVGPAIAWVEAMLSRDKLIDDDARRLRQIVRVDPEILCCKQRERAACCSPARRTRTRTR